MTPGTSRAALTAAMKALAGSDLWLEDGRRARIVGVVRDHIQVKWLRPMGDPENPLVPLAQIAEAVALLEGEGAVQVSKEALGFRPELVAALIALLPGYRLSGGSPPRISKA